MAGKIATRAAYGKALAEFAGQMDYDSAEMVINSVGQYSLEPEDEKKFKEIKCFHKNADFLTYIF